MRSNPIRFSGMASGMDTDSIVKDMMRPQQYKIDQQKKLQALVKLKQDAWKDMNKKLHDFHTKFTDKMRSEGTFNQNEVTSSNPNAITINKGGVVPGGTHTFDIISLAEAANVVGQVNFGKITSKDPTAGELMEGLTFPGKLVMTVNGKEITVVIAEKDKLSEVANAINKELKGLGENNKTVDTGFTASFDETNGSFFISSTATGVKQTIKFSEDNANGAKLFEKINLETGKVFEGKDASYKYNGGDFTSATNQIEVNGIKATLKSTSLGKTVISAEPNADAIYTWVKDFVKEYNNLMDDINGKLGSKPGKDIMPLTSEERKAMSDSEIKLWEEKLNGSLFYKDDILTKFADTARKTLGQIFTGVGEGEYNSLASLGIVTGSWEEKGKLHILGDEDDDIYSGQTNKLKAALEKDSSKVINLFTRMGKDLYAAHNETFKSSSRLKSAMKFYNDKSMTDQVNEFDKKISTLEERMYRVEQMQYAKFAAMEKMLSSLNNQSSWLTQQFGGM